MLMLLRQDKLIMYGDNP